MTNRELSSRIKAEPKFNSNGGLMTSYQKPFVCFCCGGRNCRSDETYDRCIYCGTKYKRKKYDDDAEWNLHAARKDREAANFDEALRTYDRIIREGGDDNTLEAAYWGKLLCEQFVIFYQGNDDTVIPSFWNINNQKCSQSPNYKKAMEYAKNSGNTETYIRQGELIEEYKEKYRKVRKDLPNGNQIFICFRNGEPKKLAQSIYNRLCKKYEVFFSEETLRTIATNDYEPYIYHSLMTAKVLLLICSSREDLESKWVYNEWSRFLKFCKRTDKVIIPVFMENFEIATLPDSLVRCEGVRADTSLIATLSERLERIFPAEAPAAAPAVDPAQAELQRQKQEEEARRIQPEREAARLEKEAAKKRKQAAKEAKRQVQMEKLKGNASAWVLRGLILLVLIGTVCAVFIPPARHWIIGVLIAVVYTTVWTEVRAHTSFNYVPWYLVTNIGLGVACIPLFCISSLTRAYALGFSLAILSSAILLMVYCWKDHGETKSTERSGYGMYATTTQVTTFSFAYNPIEYITNLLSIFFGTILCGIAVGCNLTGLGAALVIGCSAGGAFVVLAILSMALYVDGDLSMTYLVFAIVAGIVSVVFFCVSKNFTVCAMGILGGIVIHALLLLIGRRSDAQLFSLIGGLILAGISVLVLLFAHKPALPEGTPSDAQESGYVETADESTTEDPIDIAF